MIDTLAALLADRARAHPEHRFGMIEAPWTLDRIVAAADTAAAALGVAGIGPGVDVAVVARNSTSNLVTWVALQLLGAQPALLDPSLPPELLARIVEPLAPAAVLWGDRAVDPSVVPGAVHLDVSAADTGVVTVDGRPIDGATAPPTDRPGLGRRPEDVAGYMHTSGTTGVPKLVVQSHEYFLRLGRFVADRLALGAADVVLAPLPLFHVNPLGYGVVGGLVGRSAVLSTARFSASAFWPAVREAGVTVAVLHAPPIEILKQRTTGADAAGHRIRAVLFADRDFMDRFAVPVGMSVYGSTEAGGLTHAWLWRRGDAVPVPEGMSRYGGQARADVRWDLGEDGEILVAGAGPGLARAVPGVLASGYRRAGGVEPLEGDDGWFHTGDLGRRTADGHLVFVERAAEAIRVKGEYVPIGYVEDQLRGVPGIDDLALWRRPSPLVDHEPVLYVTTSDPHAGDLPTAAIVAATESLPSWMRPVEVRRVAALPRDDGVGKVRRRLLEDLEVLDAVELEHAKDATKEEAWAAPAARG